MPSSDDARLENLVAQFEADLALSLEAFTGTAPHFDTKWLDTAREDVILVGLQMINGRLGVVPLQCRGRDALGLTFSFKCTLNSTRQFLAVDQSTFSIHPYANPEAQPLFRVEYVRNQDPHYPSSHLHLHAHHDQFTHLMSFASKLDVEKSKQVEGFFGKGVRLSQFHFPTGATGSAPVSRMCWRS